MSTVGERLQTVRNRAGLSQTELTRLLGWGKNRISNYETGTRLPSVEDLEFIGESLENYMHEKGVKFYLMTGSSISEYVNSGIEIKSEHESVNKALDHVYETLKFAAESGLIQFEAPYSIERFMTSVQNVMKSRAVFDVSANQ